MQTYLKAWLAFGLFFAALSFVVVLIETGEPFVALLMAGIPVALSPVFGLAKYAMDKHRGRVPEHIDEQDPTGGFLTALTRDLLGPLNLAVYASIASAVVRAAGGPIVVSLGLIVAGLIFLALARRNAGSWRSRRET